MPLRAVGYIIVAPIVFNTIGLGPVVETLLRSLRWPLLFGGALVVLAIIYRYGPSRTPARWRWVSWGGGRRDGDLDARFHRVLDLRPELRQL